MQDQIFDNYLNAVSLYCEGSRMPPPIDVQLHSYNPQWAESARIESNALVATMEPIVLSVHHVGSTAIPGMLSRPILDLMPVVSSLAGLDSRRATIESLGYEWWGELGLPGRRYCTKADSSTARRIVQLHCYVEGSSEIVRHLAFRDYLRLNPAVAAAYEQRKVHCYSLHPDDSHAYGDCKAAWISEVEAAAIASVDMTGTMSQS
jgi:GrpB-like predicted nucleotidyltransferase (UPF0157 family)